MIVTMHRTFILLSLVCTSLSLSACKGTPVAWKPEIVFLGIATGSLATPVDRLHFRNYFAANDRELVAVVAFKEPMDGMKVQATWFQPDDRNAPLGRSIVTTQSGAAVARFSFASREDWQSTPFMLWIDAEATRGKTVRTATGSLHFFMNVSPTKAEAYRREYLMYKSMEAKQIEKYQEQYAKEQQMIERLKTTLQDENLQMAGQTDLNDDGLPEYIIISTEQPSPPSSMPGLIASASTKAFALTNQSGALFLAFHKEGPRNFLTSNSGAIAAQLPPPGTDITFHLLASKTIVMAWESKMKRCISELAWENPNYSLRSEQCTDMKKDKKRW